MNKVKLAIQVLQENAASWVLKVKEETKVKLVHLVQLALLGQRDLLVMMDQRVTLVLLDSLVILVLLVNLALVE